MQLRASDAYTGDGTDGGAPDGPDGDGGGGGGDGSHNMGADEADEQFDALLTLYYATGGVGWSRNKVTFTLALTPTLTITQTLTPALALMRTLTIFILTQGVVARPS